ncbi:hypothetical protein Rsub_12170 [Raphidocelis subcapitata]|uniref:Choline kinase n=1 Tax=Raphidocelis subcapitata TaxID=307507 RepID=A0A2V0PI04_9CHLO|nr:hypothetical protein Rsub_12170 [Raphidocelis subcapitata]|eukprot:GBF99366.1 hypothetical protein Rsub_12170 [Raphidocelis subcapitata]
MASAGVLERPAAKAAPAMTGGGGGGGAGSDAPAAPPAARRVGLSVDVPLLLRAPEEALLPALRLLPGPWEGAQLEDLQVVAMSGALTNLVYRCGLVRAGAEEAVVLARIHANRGGGDGGGGEKGGGGGGRGFDLFDRQREVATFSAVSAVGLGPQLLLLFANGRFEEFLVEYVTLSAHDLPDPTVSREIAAAMAAFHVRVSEQLGETREGGGDVLLWQRLRSWLGIAERLWGRPALAEWLGTDDLASEIDALEARLTGAYPVWVAVTHNDLQYGNCMALAPGSPAEASAGLGAREAPAPPPAGRQADAEAPASADAPAGVAEVLGLRAGSIDPCRGRLLLPTGEDRIRGQSPERKRGHLPLPPGTLLGGDDDGSGGPPSPATLPGRSRRSDGGSDWRWSAASTRGGTATAGSLDAAAGAAGAGPGISGPGGGGGGGGPGGGGGSGGSGAAGGRDGSSPAGCSPAAASPAAPDPIRLIDYEYAGTAPIAFDVANHWCEWAADYHSDTPSVLDFDRMPGPAARAAFVASYLRGLLQALGHEPPPPGEGGWDSADAADDGDGAGCGEAAAGGGAEERRQPWSPREWLARHGVPRTPGAPVPAAAARSAHRQLLAAARAYESISALQWALWGLVQTRDSVVGCDFDFEEYAACKWAHFKGLTGGAAR